MPFQPFFLLTLSHQFHDLDLWFHFYTVVLKAMMYLHRDWQELAMQSLRWPVFWFLEGGFWNRLSWDFTLCIIYFTKLFFSLVVVFYVFMLACVMIWVILCLGDWKTSFVLPFSTIDPLLSTITWWQKFLMILQLWVISR